MHYHLWYSIEWFILGKLNKRVSLETVKMGWGGRKKLTMPLESKYWKWEKSKPWWWNHWERETDRAGNWFAAVRKHFATAHVGKRWFAFIRLLWSYWLMMFSRSRQMSWQDVAAWEADKLLLCCLFWGICLLVSQSSDVYYFDLINTDFLSGFVFSACILVEHLQMKIFFRLFVDSAVDILWCDSAWPCSELTGWAARKEERLGEKPIARSSV